MSGLIGKRVQFTPNPVSCPLCGIAWDFRTDFLGRLVAIHSVVRCVPKSPDVSVEEQEPTTPERRCEECYGLFRPNFRGAHKVCPQKCRNVRTQRQRKEASDRRAANWKLRLLTGSGLPTKICAVCKTPFTQRTRLSAKQFLCSSACSRARKSEQDKKFRERRRSAA